MLACMARPAPARPWLAALVLAAAALHSGEATPCAIMPIEAGSAPSPSVERVLLLYDDEHRTEHFVREVRFEGASSTFAFVVPTPTCPELAEGRAQARSPSRSRTSSLNRSGGMAPSGTWVAFQADALRITTPPILRPRFPTRQSFVTSHAILLGPGW